MRLRPGTLGKLSITGLILLPVLWAFHESPELNEEPDPPVTPAPLKRLRPRPKQTVTTIPADSSLTRRMKPDTAGETVVRRPVRGSIHPFLSGALDATARAEGEKILERMCEMWQYNWCCYARSGFSSRAYTVLYLLARGYPELAEGWAENRCESSTPSWEARPAVQVLCELARHHFGGAESVLRRLCRSSDDYVRKEAQVYFAVQDRKARLDLARQGDERAIELLSYWPDPEALDLCRELLALWADRSWPWVGARENAKEAATRLEAFAQGTWEPWVKKIIEEESSENEHFIWALEVAKDRRPAWLLKTLRARLTSEYRKGTVRLDPPGENGYEFDDVLLALVESGGGVDERELAYLQRFGFACDPREWVIDALRLAPQLRKRRALERVLESSKFTFTEMVESSLREVKDGTVMSIRMTMDSIGFGRTEAWIISGAKTIFVEKDLLGWGGCVGPQGPDQSELASALKIKLTDAIGTALTKERGTAIEAKGSFNEAKRAEIAVHIYWDGKVRIVTIDGETGEVTRVKDGGKIEDALGR